MFDPVSRRTVLRSVVSGTLVATAGCLSADRSDSAPATGPTSTTITTGSTTTDAEPTSTTLTTATSDWRRCDGRRIPTSSASRAGNVDPKSYPTVPEELTGQTVTEFVTEMEQAYVWNRILERERNLTYIDIMSVSVADSKHTEKGFVVYLVLEFGYGTGEDEDGEATVHADGAVKSSYLVNDRFVGRVEDEDWEHVDPREASDGTVLWCTPKSTETDST